MKNRMFGDDQPEQPSPRTTIVGGRPPEDARPLPPIPTGLQGLLRLAAMDDGFSRELLARRSAIATAAGVNLVASERAVLDAATSEQLVAMIRNLPPPPTDRRTFLKDAALAAVAVLAGGALSGCDERPVRNLTQSHGGAPPDIPPPPPLPGPDAGELDRPDRPEMHTKGGAPPEVPPPRADRNGTPLEGGIAPHEPEEPPRAAPASPPDADVPPRPDRPRTQTKGGIHHDVPPEKPKE